MSLLSARKSHPLGAREAPIALLLAALPLCSSTRLNVRGHPMTFKASAS